MLCDTDMQRNMKQQGMWKKNIQGETQNFYKKTKVEMDKKNLHKETKVGRLL